MVVSPKTPSENENSTAIADYRTTVNHFDHGTSNARLCSLILDETCKQGKSLSFRFKVVGKPINLIIEDLLYLSQIVKEGLNHGMENLGNLVWTQTLLQTQLLGSKTSCHSRPST